ncbi:hypothetical protein WK91_06995 [Burkholderia cepacia]|nr:hypothetical protein WK91_06995 [Burkholderia cepacia]
MLALMIRILRTRYRKSMTRAQASCWTMTASQRLGWMVAWKCHCLRAIRQRCPMKFAARMRYYFVGRRSTNATASFGLF